jgi:hypothetical protein
MCDSSDAAFPLNMRPFSGQHFADCARIIKTGQTEAYYLRRLIALYRHKERLLKRPSTE